MQGCGTSFWVEGRLMSAHPWFQLSLQGPLPSFTGRRAVAAFSRPADNADGLVVEVNLSLLAAVNRGTCLDISYDCSGPHSVGGDVDEGGGNDGDSQMVALFKTSLAPSEGSLVLGCGVRAVAAPACTCCDASPPPDFPRLLPPILNLTSLLRCDAVVLVPRAA